MNRLFLLLMSFCELSGANLKVNEETNLSCSEMKQVLFHSFTELRVLTDAELLHRFKIFVAITDKLFGFCAFSFLGPCLFGATLEETWVNDFILMTLSLENSLQRKRC